MIDYSNPFLQSLGNIRTQPQQNQFNQQQNQYDFSGWGDRLGKIEEGIAGLTKQFNSFQTPGDVAPEYTGNAAPEPLEQSANAPEPLGGIESLAGAPSNIGEVADVYGGGYRGLEPQPTSSAPTPTTPMGGQSLTRRGPLSLTEKLRNEYLMGSAVGDLAGIGAPVTMGGEWDARAKEMGFDFRKQVRQLDSGEWAGTGQGADHFNKLFEEAGGVLDRPEHGAAARYGEGFTNWLGDKGYEVYTEPQQEWMTQKQGLAGAGDLGFGQDTSGYIPHLSQYAMTAEEMQDPTGTLEARRNKLYQPSGDVGSIPGFEELNRLRGGKQDDMNFSYQGRPNDLEQPIGGPTREQQLQALQGGWRPEYSLQTQSSLSGPTQQKIQQGLGSLGAGI